MKLFNLTPHQIRMCRKIMSPLKRIGIKKEFTIISNNCWGGRIYDILGLQYLSPTIGLSINPIDFVKFCLNLDYYLDKNLNPINERQNKINYEYGFYYANLDDITINFVHYSDVFDGISKWNRRKKRIVKENIIVKLSYSPVIFDENDPVIIGFKKIPYKKILFTGNKQLAEYFNYVNSYYFPNVDKNRLIINEFSYADKIFPLKHLKRIINE